MASDRVKRQIDRLLDEAEQAIAEGDWGTVRVQAHSVPRLDPENADTLLQRASTSSARTGSEVDRLKAMSLLNEALAISSDLGMRPLMDRVLSRREILRA